MPLRLAMSYLQELKPLFFVYVENSEKMVAFLDVSSFAQFSLQPVETLLVSKEMAWAPIFLSLLLT